MTARAGLDISDHALLRLLERAGGLDVAALRTAIRASLQRATDAADALGQSDYHVVADGLTYVVRGGVLVTLLPGAHLR
ncbi:hypothetical protein [Rhodopseudomonas palustris]|uniref:Uncharacterized protein n=1 Tax=Rhodopseudomonas palustris TaxID=1076 RepID=A0A418V483_RHOPL|nr:hypothetical protein [Rhodopseudomonas palustris]RJF70893.1 hypothetical protein D4Q52_14790 [Rhodopseudomonas palustris]